MSTRAQRPDWQASGLRRTALRGVSDQRAIDVDRRLAAARAISRVRLALCLVLVLVVESLAMIGVDAFDSMPRESDAAETDRRLPGADHASPLFESSSGELNEPEGETDPADDFDARLRALEQKWQAERDVKQSKRAADSLKPTVIWTGQVQVDAAWFNQSPLNEQTVGDIEDGVDFRRARLGAFGDFLQTTEYHIEFDFALAGRPTFLDNWVGFAEVPILGTVRFGHYFEPFSLERFTPNRYMTFLERSLADSFAPARNTGAAFFNNSEDGRVTWAAGIFRSQSDNFGDSIGDAGGWAGTGRVTWVPWSDEPIPDTHFVHLGAAYSYRDVSAATMQFSTPPEIRMSQDGEGSVPSFADTGQIPVEHFQLLGAEAALVLGSFSLQSEYMLVPVSLRTGGHPVFQAAYVYASWFLTGEHRPYKAPDSHGRVFGVFDRVRPFTNALPALGEQVGDVPRGPGAWEVAARWSYFDLDDAGIEGGRLNELTFGLNWYANPYTRVTFNYVAPILDNPQFGTSSGNFFGLRFGFDF